MMPNGGFDGGSRFDDGQRMAPAAIENDWLYIVMPGDVGDLQYDDAVIPGLDGLVKTGLDPHTAPAKENGAARR
ncbi:hypothetical protein MSEO_30280 [Mycobacterium seoulense]|uniref:Uncharacterized protein n=1 Tax=Mycobacterium seoulense TaxID=386911 RepID=A0A7I7P1G7_9MYCO|nr:hypothetical protein MSEO_30280 [Mycobacterium seoulense]